MFGRISERSIRIVRWALVGGWLLLIASLLFDPYSARLTRPDVARSPFRLNRSAAASQASDRYRCPVADAQGAVDWAGLAPGACDPRCARVRDRCLVQRPYALGARVFWTMILPLVPLFLMVFGHEAWRRICPLSALMQIPRRLGIGRRDTVVDPRTGKRESRVRLVKAGGFLARYFWFVQFGLLWLGLSFRLLFINSDRFALAAFFSGVIVAAIAVGYLFGGKTWCQYLCPVSPVQKFYTEPRGLFEGKGHLGAGPGESTLTQSACRKIDAQGKEHSTCVACRSPCPDIDLERQYWRDLETAGRRFFYYGYLGLVLGFYCYYRLYAGNWEYYFTGAWTHDESQLGTLLSPGWFVFGRAIGVPKVIAAPVTLAAFILVAYGCGRLIEWIYRLWSDSRGRPLPVAELRHRVFALFTFATFNAFYGFAGRPNIALLPPFLRAGVDAILVVVSTAWLVTRFGRTLDQYERESIEGSLRRQLVQLRLDTPRLFHGRSLNHLRTDEIYALGRVLPELTASQGRIAYRETVRDAVTAGHTRSAAALDVLRSLRQQLKVSEDEHASVISELGWGEQDGLDPARASVQERHLRMDAYRAEIQAILTPFLESGTNLGEALRAPKVQARVARHQATYSIDKLEHEEVCQSLLGSEGALIRRARDVTRHLLRLDRIRSTLMRVVGERQPLARLLVLSLARRQERLASRVAAHLSALGDAEESRSIGRMVTQSRAAATAVLKAANHLEPALVAVIEDVEAGTRAPEDELPLSLALTEIATSWEPLAQHIARALASEGQPGAEQIEDLGPLDRMSQLAASPLFEHLSLEALAGIASVSTPREYAVGEVICTRGTPSDGVLLVVSGAAQILMTTPEGATHGIVEAGQTIGELGALSGGKWNETVVAARQGASALCIPTERFRAFLDADPHAAAGLLRLVSVRLRDSRTSATRAIVSSHDDGSPPN